MQNNSFPSFHFDEIFGTKFKIPILLCMLLRRHLVSILSNIWSKITLPLQIPMGIFWVTIPSKSFATLNPTLLKFPMILKTLSRSKNVRLQVAQDTILITTRKCNKFKLWFSCRIVVNKKSLSVVFWPLSKTKVWILGGGRISMATQTITSAETMLANTLVVVVRSLSKHF